VIGLIRQQPGIRRSVEQQDGIGPAFAGARHVRCVRREGDAS